jgi:hypothetical protein
MVSTAVSPRNGDLPRYHTIPYAKSPSFAILHGLIGLIDIVFTVPDENTPVAEDPQHHNHSSLETTQVSASCATTRAIACRLDRDQCNRGLQTLTGTLEDKVTEMLHHVVYPLMGDLLSRSAGMLRR